MGNKSRISYCPVDQNHFTCNWIWCAWSKRLRWLLTKLFRSWQPNHDAVVNSQFGSSYTIIEDEFRIASVFRITIFGLQVLIYYLSNNWRYYLRRNNCVADADSQMPNDSNHLINFYYIEQVFENQAKKLEFVKPKIIFFSIWFFAPKLEKS